jgi:hypothetical protein
LKKTKKTKEKEKEKEKENERMENNPTLSAFPFLATIVS